MERPPVGTGGIESQQLYPTQEAIHTLSQHPSAVFANVQFLSIPRAGVNEESGTPWLAEFASGPSGELGVYHANRSEEVMAMDGVWWIEYKTSRIYVPVGQTPDDFASALEQAATWIRDGSVPVENLRVLQFADGRVLEVELVADGHPIEEWLRDRGALS